MTDDFIYLNEIKNKLSSQIYNLEFEISCVLAIKDEHTKIFNSINDEFHSLLNKLTNNELTDYEVITALLKEMETALNSSFQHITFYQNRYVALDKQLTKAKRKLKTVKQTLKLFTC